MLDVHALGEVGVVTLSGLAAAFTIEQARASGLRKDQLYQMVRSGDIERVGRGVYLQPEAIDPQFAALAAVTAARAEATMCLTSALAYHELSDAIPFGTDIALPRSIRRPAGFEHVIWHSFDGGTFSNGRETHRIAPGVVVGIYSAERSIIDAFRLAHLEGRELGHKALRRWLLRPGTSPARLLQAAAPFPKAQPRLRHALEVLL